MPTCIICLSDLRDPAALPCGHVFCYDCITRLIRSTTPYTSNHFCPTCKQSYAIVNVDPLLVPHHLRSHITPSVRKLHLEYTLPAPGKTSTSSECGKLLAENASLRTCCFVWRKRAAVHAAATLGLVGLARLARDYGLQMKKERDEMEAKYNELKTLYDQKLSSSPETPPDSPREPSSPRNEQLRAKSYSPRPRLPHISELIQPLECHLLPSLSRVRSPSPALSRRPLSPSLYRMPSPAASDSSFCSSCAECAGRARDGDGACHKRKRAFYEADAESTPEAEERPIKRSHSESPRMDLDANVDVDEQPHVAAPAPLTPGRAIASYLEGTLSI